MGPVRAPRLVSFLVVAALLCGCDGDDGHAAASGGASTSSGGPEDCAPGEWPYDGACRAAGLPPDWAEPGPTTSVAAGVPPDACATGFVSDGEGGCDPILPDAPCPSGTLALPGDTACHEVAPCAAGTWGDIPVEADTQHVDAAYSGGDGDGSAVKPWTSVQAAIDAAAPGAIVAVAAGSYPEDLDIAGKSVRLWGRCPSMVELAGISPDYSLRIADAPDTEVRGVALFGGGGIVLGRSPGTRLSELWIHDTDNVAAWLADVELLDSEVRLEDSLVERARGAALFLGGAWAHLDRVVVRDTQTAAGMSIAHGVEVSSHLDTGHPARVVIERSLLERHRGLAILAVDSELTVQGSLIQETLDDGEEGGAALGIYRIEPDAPASATVRASVFQGSFDRGAFTMGAELTLENSVVRDTSAGSDALGIGVFAGAGIGGRGRLAVRTSRVERSDSVGLQIEQADAVIERALVRDSRIGILGYGHGPPEDRARVEVRESLVERSASSGISLRATDGTIEDSVVRDTVADVEDYGAGIGVLTAPDGPGGSIVAVRRCLVERSEVYGINVTGSEATVEGTRVADTRANAAGWQGIGLTAFPDADTAAPATVALTGSIVETSRERGVAVVNSQLTVEASVIDDTLPRESDGELGHGLDVQSDGDADTTAIVRWSVVKGNRSAGVIVAGADVTLEGTLVADQLPDDAGAYGTCVGAISHPESGRRSSLTVRGSRIERCPQGGLVGQASDLVIDRTVIADIDAQAFDGRFGRCLSLQADATLQLLSSSLERCRDANIVVIDSTATIESTSILQALPRTSDGLAGDGVSVRGRSPVAIVRSRIADSARAGVAVFGSTVSLEDTELECNPIPLNAEPLDGPGTLEDRGGNVCGCDGVEAACVAQTASLAPPEPLPP